MLEKLFDRFDRDYLARRMHLQVDFVTRLWGDGKGSLHFENIDTLFPVLKAGLQATFLWRRGVSNAARPLVTKRVFSLPGLPKQWEGVKVLHLSDLHLDVDERYNVDITTKIQDALHGLDFDLCVITGDFRYSNHGRYDRVHKEMERLAPALACRHGVFGILGNHDFVEQVLYLEQAGVTMLVNESVRLDREGQPLWLVGVDDPHFYGTHDLRAAFHDVPRRDFALVLAHSPEVAEEAELSGGSLYLAGHTHGGQLCLPGGVAPFLNAKCPRNRTVGPWQLRRMQGYTSAGTGSSGLPVRLNCAAEVALHELRCAHQ